MKSRSTISSGFHPGSGFTLIELLVVIAIIAILAAILFPVFAQAREKARAISCLSNTKQMGLGFQMYTQDYDETFPYAQFWDGTSAYANAYEWSSVRCIQPYLKNTDIYKCPSDSSTSSHDATYYGLTADRVPKAISYMTNSLTPDVSGKIFGVDSPQGVIVAGNGYYASKTAPTALAAIPAPADIVVLLDGRKEYDDGIWYCGEWQNSEIDWCYTGASALYNWMFPPFTILASPGDRVYSGWRKHTGGTNVTFADGHAKFQRPGDLYTEDPARVKEVAKRWLINPPQ